MKAVLLSTFVLFYIANCRKHRPVQNVMCACYKCPVKEPEEPTITISIKPKPGTFSNWIFVNFLSNWFEILSLEKGLGKGCDPRYGMHECNGGLYCYKKSENPGDGMCVPECRNGRYISYKKILWYSENPKTIKMNRTVRMTNNVNHT